MNTYWFSYLSFGDMIGKKKALRFLALFHREPTDYVEVSKKFYENQSVEDIFKRAKEHWRS
jgi:hypothetical protein